MNELLQSQLLLSLDYICLALIVGNKFLIEKVSWH